MNVAQVRQLLAMGCGRFSRNARTWIHARRMSNASNLPVPYRTLPSELYNAAVWSGGLRGDDFMQRTALPKLDLIAKELRPFGARMQEHRQLMEEALAEREMRIEEEEHRLQLEHGEVGWMRRQWSTRFGRLSDRDRLDNYRETLKRNVPLPRPPEPPQGIYLYGDVGRGKSMLIDLLFSSARPFVEACARMHFQHFMLAAYERLHEYDQMSVADRRFYGYDHPLDAVVASGFLGEGDMTKSGGLLCFDEFQVADVGDARLIQGILQRILDCGVVVTLTANRPPDEIDRSQLRDSADFRAFLDFLDARCERHNLGGGSDYRERMLSAEQSATSLQNQSTEEYIFSVETPEDAIHERWRSLVGADWDDVEVVEVQVPMGRRFRVARASRNGKAAQLCVDDVLGRPVGPADYIALSKRFKYLFIVDAMPRFTMSTRDMARRWIWLVDAMYNAGTRVILRTETGDVESLFGDYSVADADLAATAEGLQFEGEVAKTGVGADNRGFDVTSTLYTGEDEIFALRRATSRLREMQTRGYAESPMHSSLLFPFHSRAT